MYYLKQIILLLSFAVLIFEITRLSSYKNEMEVTYESKELDRLPAISICTYMSYMQKNCVGGAKSTTANSCGVEHCDHSPSFINKTTRELFEFERRCAFLTDQYLMYVFNNSYSSATNVTPYLNFGLFCKLYEFPQIEKNYNDGFFKINSTDDHKITIFVHENGSYPVNLNLKVYFSEFKNNQKAILILLELNKVLRESGNLFRRSKQIEFNSSRDCYQHCFKSYNFSKYDFLYLEHEQNYTILDYKLEDGLDAIESTCSQRCEFDDIFESYFKTEKITFNSDLSVRNKTLTYEQWIIFFQNNRVVSFKFNPVITLSVYLIHLCNIVSLIFGFRYRQ